MHNVEQYEEFSVESLYPIAVRFELWVGGRLAPKATARVDRRPVGMGDCVEVSYNLSATGEVDSTFVKDFAVGLTDLISQTECVAASFRSR